MFEASYTPMIQSRKYNLSIGAENSTENLDFGTIICSLGAKYKLYNSNVGRTYFVDPKPVKKNFLFFFSKLLIYKKDQEETYKILLDVQSAIFKSIKKGDPLSSAYQAAQETIEKSKKPDLLAYMTKDCGAGVMKKKTN